MVGYGSAFGPKTWEYYVVSRETGNVTTTFPIDLRSTQYNHDFAATEVHSVCFDGNLVLSEGFGAPRCRPGDGPHDAQAERKPASMWTFRREIPGRIGVFPRHSTDQSQVTWFEVEPFCVSHTVNAYEDGEEVVVIANCIGFEGFKCTFSDETPQDHDACLREWRLNMRTGLPPTRYCGGCGATFLPLILHSRGCHSDSCLLSCLTTRSRTTRRFSSGATSLTWSGARLLLSCAGAPAAGAEKLCSSRGGCDVVMAKR